VAVNLQEILPELLHEHEVPGAAIGIVDPDGVERIVTAGTRGPGRGPIDEDSVFVAASLTKPVFATAVMSLVDAGALDMDRPLHEYEAEPYCNDARAGSITARMVLSHTTGFPNWRHDAPLCLRWLPGSRWGYSGEGFSYLQRVVEHVTGVRLDRYVTDTVLRPFGMDHSTLGWEDVDEAQLALGHTRDGEARPRFRPPQEKGAAGGLFTTAGDYLRFLVQSLARAHAMFDPQVRIDDGLGWGIGWGIEDTPGGRAVWQWGNDPGYKNFVIGRPADGAGAVVFTNGDRGASVYAEVVRSLFPGAHPSLETAHRPHWMLAIAPLLVDLTPRLDDLGVRRLLKIAASHRGGNAIERGVHRRGVDGVSLLGIAVQESWEAVGVAVGTPVACIGLAHAAEGEAEVTELAVLPGWRRQGLATSLIFGAAEQLGLRALQADTDKQALNFFRSTGFSVEGVVGHDAAGEHFRCRLDLPRP
jgi:CubicO group peptidase (beta-lactamase class C family)